MTTTPHFFRPDDAFVGDVIPFDDDGTAWLFYLADERHESVASDRGQGMPWRAVTTTDFVHFVDRGCVLPSGGRSAEDYDCYTGSVVRDDSGTAHLFYTGHNPNVRSHDGDLQIVCHATSNGDLTQWVKHPEWSFGALSGYAAEDWRDPFVFRPHPDGPWWMLLCARRESAPARRGGLVARLVSDDLVAWHDAKPLWDSRRFIAQECPDVFQWGEWWYLVYSEFSDSFQARYRIARSPHGPWLAPERDTVDSRAFYAPKTLELDGERYFVGWIATREGSADEGAWQWAGTLSALRATQHPDGSLGFGLPRAVTALYDQGDHRSVIGALDPLDGAHAKPGAGSGDRYSAWIGPELPSRALITAEFDVHSGTQACGLLIRASADGEETYVLRLEPPRNRLVFDRWPRGRTGGEQWQIRGDVPHSVELERPLPVGLFTVGRVIVQVHLDADLLVASVNDEVALSTRINDRAGGRLGVFAIDGGFTVSRLDVATIAETKNHP